MQFGYSLFQLALIARKWANKAATAEAVKIALGWHDKGSHAFDWLNSLVEPPVVSASGSSPSWVSSLWGDALKNISLAAAADDRDLVPDEFSPPGLVATSRLVELIEFESQDGSKLDWTKLGHSTAVRWFKAQIELSKTASIALFVPNGIRSQLIVWDHTIGMFFCYTQR